MSGERPTAIGFVGPSGSGKTTLIERLLPELSRRGHRVGVVKHHGHPIELDTEGKDTWRFRRAGALTTTLVGGDQLALFGAGATDVPLPTLLATFYRGCDLVLVEGFRAAALPSIVVARAPLPADWALPAAPIATATDPLELPIERTGAFASLPRLHLDDVVGIAELITAR